MDDRVDRPASDQEIENVVRRWNLRDRRSTKSACTKLSEPAYALHVTGPDEYRRASARDDQSKALLNTECAKGR
jgi:hypothetical protein